jgi:hypothetical protein
MGQVVHLPLLAPAYPNRSAELDPAESVLLIALRWWVANHRRGIDPLTRPCEALETAGAHDAALSVDRLMSVIARSARQPIAIHCPSCPHVSDDEKTLLHAASLAQAGEAQRAERALRTALLSAHGAEFALGPLEGIGEFFAVARLLFRRRLPPATGDIEGPIVEPWLPAGSSATIH